MGTCTSDVKGAVTARPRFANGVATASCKGLTAPRSDRLGRSLWSATPASPAGRRHDNQVVMQRANAAEVRELKPLIRYRSRERLESLGRRLQPRAPSANADLEAAHPVVGCAFAAAQVCNEKNCGKRRAYAPG
jgi:hypothetical protein